jgi:putative two-component system response regulator
MPSAKLMFKCLEKNNIALILLDIEMPETDGFTAIQELKAKEETAKIPVIFLTGNTDVENVLRGRELGAVDFISKPFSPALLLERVGLQLSQRG